MKKFLRSFNRPSPYPSPRKRGEGTIGGFSLRQFCSIAITLISFALFSCGQKADDHTITFWHFWSEPNQLFELKTLIKDFEQSHPGVHVQLTDMNWTEGKVKLFGAFNSNQPPDVLQLGIEWIPEFASAGVLKNITLDSNARSRFIHAALNAGMWQNSLYAVPWTVNTRAMFCNLDLLHKAGIAAPPRTWAELLAAVKRVNALGGDIHGWGSNAYQPHNLYKKVLPFFWQNGGDVFAVDAKTATMNSKENIAALTFYDSLSEHGLLEESRVLDDDFVHGNIGFWISGAWLTDRIKSENPSLNYIVTPMPAPDTGKTGWSILGGDFLSISAKCTKDSLAMALINYLTSEDASCNFCSIVSDAGEPADSTGYSPGSAVQHALHEQLIHSRSIPPQPHWLEIEGVIEKYVSQSLYHRMSAAESLDSAQSQVQAILDQKKK